MESVEILVERRARDWQNLADLVD